MLICLALPSLPQASHPMSLPAPCCLCLRLWACWEPSTCWPSAWSTPVCSGARSCDLAACWGLRMLPAAGRRQQEWHAAAAWSRLGLSWLSPWRTDPPPSALSTSNAARTGSAPLTCAALGPPGCGAWTQCACCCAPPPPFAPPGQSGHRRRRWHCTLCRSLCWH